MNDDVKVETIEDWGPHADHQTEEVETIWDNPVEYTEWWYCYTCKEGFIGYGTEIVWAPWDDES